MSRYQQSPNPYEYAQTAHSPFGSPVALAEEWERTIFIRRTYAHLAGALAVFAGILFTLVSVVPEPTQIRIAQMMMGGYSWLIVLGAFMFISWIANSWALSSTSLTKQYMGLGLYVVAEAIVFSPLIFIANSVPAFDGAIGTAALATAIVFGGLTSMVFLTKADFSWLGRYLTLFGFGALAFIVVGVIFPDMFANNWISMVFMILMVVFASGYILYDTSNVMHRYQTTQYVAAALALFASVALLFWYILQLVMASRR